MEVGMSLIYRTLLALHVVAAVAAVVIFWAAAVTRKGSARHVLVGRLFVWTMIAMTTSAIAMSVFNLAVPTAVHTLAEYQARTAVFSGDGSRITVDDLVRSFRLNAVWLTYVAVQLLAGLRFGTQVVRTRSTHGRDLRADAAIAAVVLVTGMVLTWFGVRVGHPLIVAFGIIGAVSSGRRLQVLARPSPSPMAWWYEHMGSLLGVGIPLHTTLLLAIGRHLPGPAGNWRLALATVTALGFPAITMWIRSYRRRFERRPSRAHDTTTPGTAAAQPA
jgi:hypothetical protein